MSAAGSQNVPGLTLFVFTGELSAFSRDEAQDLANRFRRRITGAPSSKTGYVVGANAGASKLKALGKHGIAMLGEDGF